MGQYRKVQILLECGAEPDIPNSLGETALILACYKGEQVRYEVIESWKRYDLISFEFVIKSWDSQFSVNYTKTIELLLNYGANVNYKDNDGKAPLHYLVKRGNTFPILNLNSLEWKMESEASDAPDLPEESAVYWIGSPFSERYQKTELLLKKGANPDILDSEGNTPLHQWAIDSSLTNLLIEQGANINIQNSNGITPLHNRINETSTSGIRNLLNHDVNVNLNPHKGIEVNFYGIFDTSNLNTLKLFVSKFFNSWLQYDFQIRPEEYEVFRDLVDNYNIQSDIDSLFYYMTETLRSRCFFLKYPEIMDILFQKANPDTVYTFDKNYKGTPFHLLLLPDRGSRSCVIIDNFREQRRKIVEGMLNVEFDPNIKDSNGNSRFYLFIEGSIIGDNEDQELFNQFLKHDAKIENLYSYNYILKDPEYVKLLIENNKDLNLKNKKGETLLMEAASNGNINTVKLLLDNGSDPNIKSNGGVKAIKYTDNKEIKTMIKNYSKDR